MSTLRFTAAAHLVALLIATCAVMSTSRAWGAQVDSDTVEATTQPPADIRIDPNLAQLERLLKRFDGAVHKTRQARKQWHAQLARLDEIRKQLADLQSQYEDIRARLARGSLNPLAQQQLTAQQQQITKQLNSLRTKLTQQERDVGRSKLHAAAKPYARARSQLAALRHAILYARRSQDTQRDTHSQNPAPPRDIPALPLGTRFSAKLEEINRRATKELAATKLPLVQQGKWQRIGAQIETRPVDFLLDDQHEEAVLTRSVARRLGIVTPSGAPMQTIHRNGDPLQGQWFSLKELTVGTVQLSRVQVFLLDEKYESTGSRLGTAVIDRLKLEIAPGCATLRGDDRPDRVGDH